MKKPLKPQQVSGAFVIEQDVCQPSDVPGSGITPARRGGAAAASLLLFCKNPAAHIETRPVFVYHPMRPDRRQAQRCRQA